MTTTTTKAQPTVFVAYPPTRGDPHICYTSIRNTPEAVADYVQAVAPQVAELAAEVIARRPDLAARTWYAALLVVAGKVRVDTRPCMYRLTCHRHGTAETLALVRSQFDARDYEIFTSTRDHNYPLRCTCPDADPHTGYAPSTRRTIRACKHVIAYVIVCALAEAA